MKGLDVARAFFMEWGLPYLQQHFPTLVDRVAACIFHGSQIYGADDELSQDHGWGPMFTLFLTNEDYETYGQELQQALIKDAPRIWKEFQYRYPQDNIDVITLDTFFTNMTGFATPEAWQTLAPIDKDYDHDHLLYLLRHGSVFYDPFGEFSRRRAGFHEYPHLLWLRRVERELFHVWHYGQYNFLDRLLKRKDAVSIQIALGHFTQAVMHLCLLLEHDYAPYWKWLAFEFRKRATATQLDPLLRALAETIVLEERANYVHAICDEVHRLLDQAGLSREHLGWDGWHPHPLMCDMQALRGYIDREEHKITA